MLRVSQCTRVQDMKRRVVDFAGVPKYEGNPDRNSITPPLM